MQLTSKLKAALASTRNSLSNLFSLTREPRLKPEQLDDLEEQLLLADLGIDVVSQLIDTIESSRGQRTWENVKSLLSQILQKGEFETQSISMPMVLFVTGVNGTGKTTTVAKLANWYRDKGKSVLLIAADTYRAAAIHQLEIWANRLNVRLISNEKTQDPSSVVFDGLASAKNSQIDVVIVDTAGRLHTSKNLMSELEKLYRVVESHFPEYHAKTVLTLDANLGQNSLSQTRQFKEYIKLDGVVLTKMDGTAKGGVIFPVIENYGLPVWFLGTGEHLTDLEPFSADTFLQSLLNGDESPDE